MKKFILITLCLLFTLSISLNAQKMVGAKYHKGDVISTWYQESNFTMTYQGQTRQVPVKIKVQRVVATEPTDEKYVIDTRGIPAGSYETWKEKYTYQVIVDDPNDWHQGYFTLSEGEAPTDKVYKAIGPDKPEPRGWERKEFIREED